MKAQAALYSTSYSWWVTYWCDWYWETLSYTWTYNEIPVCNESHIFSDENAMLDFYTAELVLFTIYAVVLLFIKFFGND